MMLSSSSKAKRLLLFFLPLSLFFIVVIFLALGLRSDPSVLDSALIGKPVPSFKLQDIYEPNKIHKDETVFRGKPLLLNVWATWCPTCRAEHEFLNQLAAQGVYIVGLNYKDERQLAIQWLNRLGDPYKVSLFDADGMLALDLGVYGAPETYLIDSKGVIQYRHVGNLHEQVWQERLKPIFDAMQ